MISEYYKQKIKDEKEITIKMNCIVNEVCQENGSWQFNLKEKNDNGNNPVKSFNVINATYCGTNTINRIFNVNTINLMHEITEMAIISSPAIENVGLTVMDGHFCSIMPYGLSKMHALSSVTYTHHKISYEKEPVFDCQNENKNCRPDYISICNTCFAKPASNQYKMICQMKKYLNDDIPLNYIFSMYTIKSKLQSSYIDDGRPTEISKLNDNPAYYCLFAGKINSIYEIEKEVKL
jgi:hypothetical protein